MSKYQEFRKMRTKMDGLYEEKYRRRGRNRADVRRFYLFFCMQKGKSKVGIGENEVDCIKLYTKVTIVESKISC